MHATDVLRERTACAHAALERSDFILPATRDRDRFARLVGAMLSFHVAVERELARYAGPLAACGLDVFAYQKSSTLRADARTFESPIVSEPRYALASSGEAAGALYVLEGSTLGGMLIARDVRRHLELESTYYGCYGRETAARWKATSASLDRIARTGTSLDAMVDGAELTFDTLHHHLRSQLAVS